MKRLLVEIRVLKALLLRAGSEGQRRENVYYLRERKCLLPEGIPRPAQMAGGSMDISVLLGASRWGRGYGAGLSLASRWPLAWPTTVLVPDPVT